MRRISLLVMVASLAACAMAPTIPFSDADFRSYVGDGSSNLQGSAVLTTVAGGVRTCAGFPVLLAPATAYDREVVKLFGFELNTAKRQAGPAAKYWRETNCDGAGNFVFNDVPSGTWIVITEASWTIQTATQLPGAYKVSDQKQGGTMIGEVTLYSGKSARFVMNDQNLKTIGLF